MNLQEQRQFRSRPYRKLAPYLDGGTQSTQEIGITKTTTLSIYLQRKPSKHEKVQVQIAEHQSNHSHQQVTHQGKILQNLSH